jgi:hypothetical protein
MVSATPCLLYLQERDLVLIVQEAGWASGLVWVGMKRADALPHCVPIFSQVFDSTDP